MVTSMQEAPALNERKRARRGSKKRTRKGKKRKAKQPCFHDKMRSHEHPFKRKVSHSNCISDTRSECTPHIVGTL